MIIITGQTGTGKTKNALEYAKKYNGELINCDSRQAYKYLNIISGKDLRKNSQFKIYKKINNLTVGFYEINQTKIWLYDIIDPKEYFSSFDFVKCANIVIKKLIKEKKIPIIVGGTYFYLRHLLYGIETENIPPNWSLRKELLKKNISQLQKILFQLNASLFESLNQSDKNNPHRLIRKIEIEKLKSKKTLSSPKSKLKLKIKFFLGFFFKNKNNLEEAIKKRVEKRIKQGAFEEVVDLLKKGYKKSDPGLKTIGYQQIIDFLQGKLTKEEAIKNWLNAEIQYAKRQLTFMKKDKNITPIYI